MLLVELLEGSWGSIYSLKGQLELAFGHGWCSTARLVRAMLAAVPLPPIDSRCPGVAMQFLNWTPVACGTPLSAHWTCHHHGWCVLGLQGTPMCLCAIERQNGLGQNGYGHCQRCGCWFVVVAVGYSQCCCGLLLFAAGVAVCVTLLSHLI